MLLNLHVLDLMEVSGSQMRAASALSMHQTTVSRSYWELAEQFRLQPARVPRKLCRWGGSSSLRFLRLGGSRREIVGSYQGQFLFIDREGVWIGQTLEGSRFILLARTGDGRLAMPGAIRRAIDGTPIAVSETAEPDPTAPPTP